jgi:hypothetical protein
MLSARFLGLALFRRRRPSLTMSGGGELVSAARRLCGWAAPGAASTPLTIRAADFDNRLPVVHLLHNSYDLFFAMSAFPSSESPSLPHSLRGQSLQLVQFSENRPVTHSCRNQLIVLSHIFAVSCGLIFEARQALLHLNSHSALYSAQVD